MVLILRTVLLLKMPPHLKTALLFLLRCIKLLVIKTNYKPESVESYRVLKNKPWKATGVKGGFVSR